MKQELPLLAKQSVEEYIVNRRVIPQPHGLLPELQEKAGVFVCIKKRGQLRGCIGTFSASTENIAAETIRNAIAAATQDPRFPPVLEDELKELEYSVDVLSAPEKAEDLSMLDPQKYGVIVVSGLKKGLLLPDLEGVDTVDEQIRIAKLKAGILPGEHFEVLRFRVHRYT